MRILWQKSPQTKAKREFAPYKGVWKTQKKSEPSRRFNPLNDFLFYKTMGEKGDEPQLTGFLNAILAPSGRKPIETLEIIEKKTFVKDMLEGKSCSLDVAAILSDGTRVNIEVQLNDKRNMDRRSLFYWGKLYAETLKQGIDYIELPDTIAINIVNYDFPQGGGAHTRFRLKEVSDPALELTGAIEIHFVNMVKWRELAEKDLRGNPLHRWLAWLDPESPPELVEEVKNMDGAIAFAEDRQGFVMHDDEARELYWRRQIAEMDRRAEIAFALEKAEMDHRAEIAFALEKAEMDHKAEIAFALEKAALNNARNALAKGLSIELIHEITGLDMETIADLQSQ